MPTKIRYIEDYHHDPLEKRTPLFFHELLAELAPGSRVLDLGSGGSTFQYNQFSHLMIYSCDIYFRGQELIRRPNIHYVLTSADRLPFLPESFDLIVANFVFEHFRKPLDALLESERVLKVDGHFYTAIPNSTVIEDRCYRLWKGRKDHVQTYTFHHFLRMVYCFTSFKLRSFCDYPAGFTWFDSIKKYNLLQKLFLSILKILKYFNPDILRTCNFLFCFRKEGLRGYRFLTHNCMHCGGALALSINDLSGHWRCPGCGKSNPTL